MFDFFSKKFTSLFSILKGKRRLTEKHISDTLEKVEEAFFEADVPYDVVKDFIAQMRLEAQSSAVTSAPQPGQMLIKVIHEKLKELLAGKEGATMLSSFAIPSTIMMIGLQGAGKTTTLAKLALWAKKQAEKRGKTRKILCASLDFARPAARDQLQVLASQVGIDYFHATADTAVAAAREVLAAYKQGGYQHLFVDTAGRLHIADDVMNELAQVKKIIQPKYTTLVLDTMTGQESLDVAKTFQERIEFDGAVLAKLDSDARGGAAIAFRAVLNKPVWFVGTGEKVDDIERFVPERMVSRIIGMGDLATLFEKADDVVSKPEQETAAKRLMSGNFSLIDFANQIDMVGKMGAMSKLMRYLPGASQFSPEMIDKGQKEMQLFRAIINSMTQKERLLPQILDGSRKKRIALGSGVSVQSVNLLLQKFEQSKQFAKMLKKAGKPGTFFNKR